MTTTKTPLATIVSPCYNSEQYVGRMLDSILAQTHKNIESICVNDGSTDNTEGVILSYAERFKKTGMKLIYAKQENGGLVSAINTGLKHANGDYLSWLDSDDFITPDSVEKKMVLLEDNPDYSIVSGNVNIVDESNINKVIETAGEHFGALNSQPNQFFLALTGMSIILPGSYMIRMTDFIKAQGGKRIEPCTVGQNYQTLLPVYYRFSRLYIDEPLMYYVVRENSDFHRERSDEEWLARSKELLRMLGEVLDSLGLPEWEKTKCQNMSVFNYLRG